MEHKTDFTSTHWQFGVTKKKNLNFSEIKLALYCVLSTEAYGMLKDADKKGMALGPALYDHLIRALLAKGSIEDAMVVKDM